MAVAGRPILVLILRPHSASIFAGVVRIPTVGAGLAPPVPVTPTKTSTIGPAQPDRTVHPHVKVGTFGHVFGGSLLLQQEELDFQPSENKPPPTAPLGVGLTLKLNEKLQLPFAIPSGWQRTLLDGRAPALCATLTLPFSPDPGGAAHSCGGGARPHPQSEEI